jgi:hypothetical protein
MAAKKATATGRPTANGRGTSQRQRPRDMIRIGPSAVELIENPESVLEWDDEELRRGQRRGPNGSFKGSPPAVIPRAVYNELWRRTTAQAMELMRESLPEAVALLLALAKSPNTQDRDRIKAIEMIMDRVLGKVPENVMFAETGVEGTKPKWATALDVAIVSSDD